MSEEIKNTPEEIEAVKAEDLEDTVEKENDAEAVTEDISTEEIIAEEPAAEAVAPAPVMKEKKHRLSYEKRKGLYGYGFIAIWALGTIYFFILPLIESLIYSFNKTEVTQGGMKMSFIGWKNYVNAFRKDQDYSKALVAMIEADLVDQLLNFLGIYNISDKLTEIINSLTTDILNLVWNSGIQILLVLSALQGIPLSAKEAAQIEGATSWEFFWKVTIPYISPMILSSVVYTIVDSFVDPQNEVMTIVLNKASNWEHGYSAAMAWAYFLIVAVFLALVVALVNKFVYYEVE